MDTNKMREQFEAWISSYIGSTWLGRNDHQMDEYIDENAQFMWEAWQASREAVVVELPQVVAYEAGYDSLRDNEYAGLPDRLPDFDYDELFELHRSDEVRAAIEAQGLKVGVKP